MTTNDILGNRLANQQIGGTRLKSAREMTAHLGAVQAQEYAMSKWALGMRLPGSTDADMEKAFNDGQIIRTHVLRPTWHFTAPEDLRWMLKLTAPRVNAFNAYYYRKSGLDDEIFRRCNRIFEKVLSGKNYLTRNELKKILEKEKIPPGDTVRISGIMMQAELNATICSGPRKGKQFTYALLEERVAPAKDIPKDEALAELALRYFSSRGPASVQDFAWWSGLSVTDARKGANTLPAAFVRSVINGRDCFYIPQELKGSGPPDATFLMADYDEYGIAYKDRSALLPDGTEINIAYNRMLVINGVIRGTWKREVKGNSAEVEIVPFAPLSKQDQLLVEQAVKRFTDFVENRPDKLVDN